ncbi:ABC transporter permease [Hansschlegelia sp. KR7-227]|uniref:ABC transporter permease n=1 Tax=Hansschlegelia sp. KR7-227 TaxID=3400914 RepID=UPI003C0F32AE
MSELLALFAFGPTGWGDELASGTWVTVRLALTALPVGLAIGLGAALLKNARSRGFRALGEVYGTVFRGLPELLTIFLVYFGLPRLVSRLIAACEQALGLPPSGFAADVDAFWAGAIALALAFGAYASEALSGAIRSVPAGQREAAEALGLSPAATFQLVVLPQVVRLALPALANTWLVLLKDTSLVSVIALADLTRQANVAALATRQPFAFYLVACLIYLALSIASGAVAAALERRAGRGFARTGV